MVKEMEIKLEFAGGSEFLVGNQKEHTVSIPVKGEDLTVKDVLHWIQENMLQDSDRPEMLIIGENVSPGVLVLVNECDWELMENENTKLKDGDMVSFISTLHGG